MGLPLRHVLHVLRVLPAIAWLGLQLTMLAATPPAAAAADRAALLAEAAQILPFETGSICGLGPEDDPAPRCPWCMAAGVALAPAAPADWARLGLSSPLEHRPAPVTATLLSLDFGYSSRAPPHGVRTA